MHPIYHSIALCFVLNNCSTFGALLEYPYSLFPDFPIPEYLYSLLEHLRRLHPLLCSRTEGGSRAINAGEQQTHVPLPFHLFPALALAKHTFVPHATFGLTYLFPSSGPQAPS
jgi:hypothetical protein